MLGVVFIVISQDEEQMVWAAKQATTMHTRLQCSYPPPAMFCRTSDRSAIVERRCRPCFVRENESEMVFVASTYNFLHERIFIISNSTHMWKRKTNTAQERFVAYNYFDIYHPPGHVGRLRFFKVQYSTVQNFISSLVRF